MTRYWNRNLISSTERLPTSSATSGIYDLVSQKVYKQADLWPAAVPPVVTQGVEVFLDAGDSSSYGGTGTTWSDLSGNNNDGTLTNMDAANYSGSDGGSDGSYFTFDGSNEYVDVSGSETLTAATFLVWCYKDGNQGNNTGLIFSRSSYATGLMFASNQVGYTWNSASNTYNWTSGLWTPNYEWYMHAVTVTSTSATAYLFTNSSTTSATNSVSHSSATMDTINVGRDSSSVGRYFDGRISVAMVYSRALSSTELTQNFNAFKGRYGY